MSPPTNALPYSHTPPQGYLDVGTVVTEETSAETAALVGMRIRQVGPGA